MDFGGGSFGFAFRSGVWGDMDFVPTLRVDELDVTTRSSVIEAGRLAMKKKLHGLGPFNQRTRICSGHHQNVMMGPTRAGVLDSWAQIRSRLGCDSGSS